MVFASSVFVPVETMPNWLQAFAKINPITISVDTVRGLSLGGNLQTPVIGAFFGFFCWFWFLSQLLFTPTKEESKV